MGSSTQSAAGVCVTSLPFSSILDDHGEAPLEPEEGARIWRHSALTGVELFQGTYRKHEFARHFHTVPAIGVVDHGSMRTYCQKANHDLPAGSVLLLNPGEVHAPGPNCEKGWSFRMFYFGNSIFKEWSEKITNQLIHFSTPVVQDRLLAQALLRLHRTLETPATPLETDSAMLSVFTQLGRNHASATLPTKPARPDRNAVNQAKEYLRARYTENVSLSELAEVAQVSQFHLVRAFHRAVGLPPHSYLIQLRIEAAQTMLRSGKAISEVASLVGFTDQSHLTRHFKRLTGVTPNQYRPRAA